MVAEYNGAEKQTTIELDPGGSPSVRPGLVVVHVVTSSGTLGFEY